MEYDLGSVEGKFDIYYSKESQLLQIIKDRVVDIGLLKDCKTEPEYLNRLCHRVYAEQNDFNEKPAYKRMSQEEFDLLKEYFNEKH